MSAKTAMFKRVEQWRVASGRNPKTGFIQSERREQGIRPVDDSYLVVVALRMAAETTRRDDLRPHYERLAKEIEQVRAAAIDAARKGE